MLKIGILGRDVVDCSFPNNGMPDEDDDWVGLVVICEIPIINQYNSLNLNV